MTTRKIAIPSIHIGRIDSWSILDAMLEHTLQPCSVVICSFAIAEGWVKRLMKLKQKGKIEKIIVLLDRAVMIRHRSKILLMESVIDEMYFNDTHAKLLMVTSKDFEAVAVMSANATMNYRIETFYITDKANDVNVIREDLQRIYDNSRSIKPGGGTLRAVLHP